MRWSEVISRLDELTSRERALRVLLVPAHRGLPDQAEQPVGRARRGRCPAGATCSTTSSCPTRCSAPPAGSATRSPRVITAGQRRGRPGAGRAAATSTPRTGSSPARGGSGSRSRSTRSRGSHLADVLAEVRALFARRDWRISFPIEVRVTPGDDLWLSTAYGRDSAYIAIHVFHASPHEEYFRDVEAVMTAVGGRPHWGKMHTRSAEYLRQAYPRYARLRRAARRTRPRAPVRQRLPGSGTRPVSRGSTSRRTPGLARAVARTADGGLRQARRGRLPL